MEFFQVVNKCYVSCKTCNGIGCQRCGHKIISNVDRLFYDLDAFEKQCVNSIDQVISQKLNCSHEIDLTLRLIIICGLDIEIVIKYLQLNFYPLLIKGIIQFRPIDDIKIIYNTIPNIFDKKIEYYQYILDRQISNQETDELLLFLWKTLNITPLTLPKEIIERLHKHL